MNSFSLLELVHSIIIIITTLFKSQIFLAEHMCSTNWGDCKSTQIKCWFLRRGENWSTRRKTSRNREENQQTQSTYDAECGNRTQDTLVEGERSHHCANPCSPIPSPPFLLPHSFPPIPSLRVVFKLPLRVHPGPLLCFQCTRLLGNRSKFSFRRENS